MKRIFIVIPLLVLFSLAFAPASQLAPAGFAPTYSQISVHPYKAIYANQQLTVKVTVTNNTAQPINVLDLTFYKFTKGRRPAGSDTLHYTPWDSYRFPLQPGQSLTASIVWADPNQYIFRWSAAVTYVAFTTSGSGPAIDVQPAAPYLTSR